MAVTTFMLGIKVGKDYSFEKTGITQGDRDRVDLLSTEEEAVNKIMKEKGDAQENTPINIDSVHKSLEDKIRQELEQENDKFNEAKPADKVEVAPAIPVEEVQAAPAPTSKPNVNDPYAGKFTIQLGSHRSIKEAEEFAQGFKARGYNPIVSEVEIAGRGTWFRVSLGAFDNITEAKDYIIKEKSLFQGQDYVITRFE